MSALRSRTSGSQAVWLLAAFVLAAAAGCATADDDLAGDAAPGTEPVTGEAEGPLVFAPCQNNARRCNGRRVQTCRNGTWVNGSTCAFVCSGGRCTGQCTPGARRCSGNTTQVCNQNASWQNQATCQFICRSGQCTGQCTPGARRCSGNTSQACNQDGQWVSAGTCAFTCQNGQCTGP